MPIRRAHRVRFTTSERLNSLGLSERDLDALVADIETCHTDPGSHPARRFCRKQFLRLAVPLHVEQPGGTTTTFPVVSRNISRDGMAILHRAYIHVGTRCQAVLPLRHVGQITVPARVVRCRHVRGMVHEIGLRFDTQIELRDLLDLDISADWFNLESVDPATLAGSILIIDRSEADRGLLRAHLADTQLRITIAHGAPAARAALGRPFDLIISEYFIDGAPAEELLLDIRRAAPRTPLIIATAKISDLTRRRLSAFAGAVLIKPLDRTTVLRAIAEFISPIGEPSTARPA